MKDTTLLKRLKPAAHQKWLIMISGISWAGVGIFLSFLAFKWLRLYDWKTIIIVNLIGIPIGLFKAFFVFSKVSKRNIKRILQLPQYACVFAFQDWKSYGLIVVMMGTGIYLRTNPAIPKYYLAPVYIAVGVALFFSSFRYFRYLAHPEQS